VLLVLDLWCCVITLFTLDAVHYWGTPTDVLLLAKHQGVKSDFHESQNNLLSVTVNSRKSWNLHHSLVLSTNSSSHACFGPISVWPSAAAAGMGTINALS
jgi:hypothetical protein